ncbi:MAG: D-amino acid aminotransferase [Gammaproteobacteria bacterium]|nr:D-amino acid aminotransferase [Gammaproteobacteria bacterium]
MDNKPNIVYLNGQYMPVEKATVSVMDRGFLFGDSVYEVIPVFGKNLLRIDGHLLRLQNSLNRISLPNPHDDDEWQAIFTDLLEKNNGEDCAIYLQISRGAYAKRDLSVKTPAGRPTVFAMVFQVTPPDIDVLSAGISAITVDDFRWNACDIKTTSLLANVMLRQQASDANVEDAILVKNGIVTEGTASNVFIVKNSVLVTPPMGRLLLPGITRDLVIEIANNNAILIEERELKEAELYAADEIWMTSSTREIAPVIRLNGKAVGSGKAGPMWKRVMDLYQQYKQQLRNGDVK